MTIDKNKVFILSDAASLKEKFFGLMLNQEEYPFGEFVMEIYFCGWAFMVYLDECGTVMLRYHKEKDAPQEQVFMSMGGLCSFVLNECLKIKL